MAYEVVDVKPDPRQWENKHNNQPMLSWRIDIRDASGTVHQNVELAQRASSPAPTVGQALEGNLDNTQYGLKFKKAFAPGAGGGGGGYKGKSPSEQASIAASVALDKALIAVEQAATLGLVKLDLADPDVLGAHAALIDRYFAHFFKLIDAKGKAAEAA
jgi:hypothetical protein